jgi:hypothetical protein
MYNMPKKLLQKPVDEKLSPSVIEYSPLSIISHKMALAALLG